jgi:hypothetical protein
MHCLRLLVVLNCLLLSTAYGQVQFTSFPYELQFFPRDSSGYGFIPVKGKSKTPGIAFLNLELVKTSNDSVTFNKVIKIIGDSNFSTEVPIPAVISEFKLHAVVYDLSGKLLAHDSVGRLVAGDVFMVMGQSNAEAPAPEADWIKHDSLFSLPYCRAIGFNYSFAQFALKTTIQEDSKFKTPSSVLWAKETSGYLGAWPLRLQYELSVRSGVPNCFLNGSQGASRIWHHLPRSTPSDPAQLIGDSAFFNWRLYERAFMKLYLSGCSEALKGIFWYQGESDGDFNSDTAYQYKSKFAKLREAWKADFPRLERIFLSQINTGCGGTYIDLMRQNQVEISNIYTDVSIMSTVGFEIRDKAADGCHYSISGHNRVGENLAALALSELYGVKFPQDSIHAPALARAYYTSPEIICLEFDMPVVPQLSTKYESGTAYLKHFFFDQDDDGFEIKEIRYEGKKIFLHLGYGTSPELITYLPDLFTNIGTVYCGPWILNAKNQRIGALSFYRQPVSYSSLLEAGDILYPNPARDEATLISQRKLKSIIIIGVDGKIYANLKGSNSNLFRINLSDFESGVYNVQLVGRSGERSCKKLVVIK